MVFSSYVFLLMFLVVHLLAYSLVPQRAKNYVLLASSLVFYAWSGFDFVGLLMGETAIAWLCGLLMEGAGKRRRRAALVGGLVALLLLFFAFKYTSTVLYKCQAFFGVPQEVPMIVVPLGISFYTLRLIGYLADVYRQRIDAQPAYWKLLLYSSLFHLCVAGPIVPYRMLEDGLERRRATRDDVYAGVRRFCVGLAKKALLANACAVAADTLVPIGTDKLAAQPVTAYWLGALFYALQVYLDYSAYCDMAIGLGRMIGLTYPENFSYPYQAASVTDYWHRWNMSLVGFFGDYVYRPLGGGRTTWRFVRNMAIVWLLAGVWHGLSVNFLLWSLYFFVILLFERFVVRNHMPRVLGHLLTLVVIYFGWVLFRFQNLNELVAVVRGMFGATTGGLFGQGVRIVMLQNVFLLVLSVLACTDAGKRIRAFAYERAQRNESVLAVYCAFEAIVPALLLLLSICCLSGASYSPFVYAQF